MPNDIKPAVVAAGRGPGNINNDSAPTIPQKVVHVSLVGLLDLLGTLVPGLEAQPGLEPIWVAEIQRELVEYLTCPEAPFHLNSMEPASQRLDTTGRYGDQYGD